MRRILVLLALGLCVVACGSQSTTTVTVTTSPTAPSGAPVAELSVQQTQVLLDQQSKLADIAGRVQQSKLVALAHDYETATSDQKPAILRQIADVDPFAVKHDRAGQPIALDEQTIADAKRTPPPPSDPDGAAAPLVSEIIRIITDANASGATKFARTPGWEGPVYTVSEFIDSQTKTLTPDAQAQASRLTSFGAQLPGGNGYVPPTTTTTPTQTSASPPTTPGALHCADVGPANSDTGLSEITAQNISCDEARSVLTTWFDDPSAPQAGPQGWACSTQQTSSYSYRTTCREGAARIEFTQQSA